MKSATDLDLSSQLTPYPYSTHEKVDVLRRQVGCSRGRHRIRKGASNSTSPAFSITLDHYYSKFLDGPPPQLSLHVNVSELGMYLTILFKNSGFFLE